jgi:hypothetical protein
MTTETNLTQLHDIIVATLRAQFPAMKAVEFYREGQDGREPLRAEDLPACILDLTELEEDPEEEPGTGQLAARFRFEADLVLPFRALRSKLAIRLQAASFASYLRKQSRWPGINQAGRIEAINAYRSDFQPELDQYEVWRVEWRQLLHIGTDVWADLPGSPGTPSTVFLGEFPEIGPGNEPNYDQVAP